MTKHEQILSVLPQTFDPPIDLDMFPNVGIIRIEKDNDNVIFCQIWDGLWHPLEETDRNYDLVADSILNRLNVAK